MVKSSLSVSPSSSVDFVVRNVWNAMMLLFHVQISGIFEPFMEETNWARIALSCHFESVFWFGTIAILPCTLPGSSKRLTLWIPSCSTQFANELMHLFVRRDPRLQHGQSDDNIATLRLLLLAQDSAPLLVLGAYFAHPCLMSFWTHQTPLRMSSHKLRDSVPVRKTTSKASYLERRFPMDPPS